MVRPNTVAPIATTGTIAIARPVSVGDIQAQQGDATDHLRCEPEQHRDVHGDRVLQHARVGREPVRELACADLVKERHVLPQDRLVQLLPQPGDDPLARPA
jgi:hypothetical protein